jgi:hypothetical protein
MKILQTFMAGSSTPQLPWTLHLRYVPFKQGGVSSMPSLLGAWTWWSIWTCKGSCGVLVSRLTIMQVRPSQCELGVVTVASNIHHLQDGRASARWNMLPPHQISACTNSPLAAFYAAISSTNDPKILLDLLAIPTSQIDIYLGHGLAVASQLRLHPGRCFIVTKYKCICEMYAQFIPQSILSFTIQNSPHRFSSENI